MAARNRLVISGTLGTPPVEAWSVGLNFTDNNGGLIATQAALEAWAINVRGQLLAYTASGVIDQHLSTVGRITRVDAYYYPGAGPATLQASAPFGTPRAGSNAPTAPFQTARCISLRTGQAGRSFRGRIYWPAVGVTIGNDGRAPISQANGDVFRNLLVGFENDGTVSDRLALAVYSEKLDQITPVTSLRFGDVLDTQRRRRDALPENYVSSVVT